MVIEYVFGFCMLKVVLVVYLFYEMDERSKDVLKDKDSKYKYHVILCIRKAESYPLGLFY